MFPGNRNQAPATRARETRMLVGMIAAGVLVGGVATLLLGASGGWWEPSSAAAEAAQAAAPTTTEAGAKVTPAPVPATKPATKPAVAKPGTPGASAARVRSGAGAAGKSGSGARAGAVVQSPAHLDDQVSYQYNALGRRDPFQSLLNGEYVGSDVGGDAPPDVGGLKVVGIVWGDADQFALVEDARGDSHVLRRGDKVMNGFVEKLNREAMIVNLTLDGQSQSVRIPLTRKGDKSNANR